MFFVKFYSFETDIEGLFGMVDHPFAFFLNLAWLTRYQTFQIWVSMLDTLNTAHITKKSTHSPVIRSFIIVWQPYCFLVGMHCGLQSLLLWNSQRNFSHLILKTSKPLLPRKRNMTPWTLLTLMWFPFFAL